MRVKNNARRSQCCMTAAVPAGDCVRCVCVPVCVHMLRRVPGIACEYTRDTMQVRYVYRGRLYEQEVLHTSGDT